MVALECRIECGPFSAPLSQLFTGFALLARAGVAEVRLRQAASSWRDLATVIGVVLGDGTRLFYDVGDAAHIRGDALEWCDRYYKRSYAPSIAPDVSSPKVHPLGFNYAAYTHGDWRYRRMLWTALRTGPRGAPNTARSIADASAWLSRIARRPAGRRLCPVDAFEATPSPRSQPRVLLLTRTWDATQVRGDLALSEAWVALNEQRAACIRALRREFGGAALCGFAPSGDAVRDYPDCVMPDERMSAKRAYLELMQRSDICIATTGLAGSNGWRLGEYVASSRAIVSERLLSEVPGDFADGRNYLSFIDADGCIDAAVRLFEDRDRRLAMMEQNQRYYRAFLRPERLVLNTLDPGSAPST